MRPRNAPHSSGQPLTRIKLWYACLLLIAAVFVVRLFYLQIIRHSYYQQAALKSQLKQYQIAPERGTILAHNGDSNTPLVLNQTLYTLYGDPKFIQNLDATTAALQKTIGGNVGDYEAKIKAGGRYQILAKKLTPAQSSAITKLKLKGIGTQAVSYRTYPQGQLAAQLLGFVNDDGDGQYGVEQALNKLLKGKPGELKAITDAQGVPLAANQGNIDVPAVPGQQVLLTIDLGMQQQLEDILKQQVDQNHAKLASAVILDAQSGAVKAMGNVPTYNPSEFYKVSDASVFTNAVASNAFEVGSIMKVLTAAAALDSGAVTKNQTYYDPSHFTVDDATVRNIEEDGGAGTKSLYDILQLSLNTGATWLLMQMGGGQINQKARDTWHTYLVDHYQFGKRTGIEQSYEGSGTVPDPKHGYGLNIQYANTAFGQGQTETLLQMAAALTAVVNGGTYYQPHVVDGYITADGKITHETPKTVRTNVVRPDVSAAIREFMTYIISKNYRFYGQTSVRDQYSFGGKTGTAQVPNPKGGYYDDRTNGTFMGFVGGDQPQYIIVVGFLEPHVGGYAGSTAAAPVYFKLANMLIDNFGVNPKS